MLGPKRTGRRRGRVVGNLSRHLGQVVRKDVEFLKNRIGKGVEWVNGALRIPQLSKTVDDLIWLRNLEDPRFPSFPRLSWPQPFYPGYTACVRACVFIDTLDAQIHAMLVRIVLCMR